MDQTTKDPQQRAIDFSKSQQYVDIVKKAKENGIIVNMEGMKTIVKRETDDSESVMMTEWRWDEPDSEEFILNILQKEVDVYMNQRRDLKN